MANELQFYGDPSADSGRTVIARVYDSAGAQVGSDVSCTEVGVLAIYTGTMPAAGAGQYGVRFFESTTLLGQGVVDWDGTAEVLPSTTDATIATNLDAAVSSRSSHAEPDLSNLDAAVSTRLAGAVYTAPLDAVGVRGAVGLAAADLDVQLNALSTHTATDVRTELATELARIDVATSTRSSHAPAAIRTELATELGRIDVATSTRSSHAAPDLTNLDATISSRLAASAYTTAPTAASVADAVWDEPRGDHTTAGTMGESQPDQDLSALATASDLATVDGIVDAILVDTGTTLPGLISGSSGGASAADIYTYFTDASREDAFKADTSGLSTHSAADVWAVSTRQVTGMTGTIQTLDALDTAQDTQHLNTQTVIAAANGNIVDGIPTTTEIADAVWDEARAGHTTTGTYGAVSEWTVDDVSTSDIVMALYPDLNVINEGVQSASLLVPHTTDLVTVVLEPPVNTAVPVWSTTVISVGDTVAFTPGTYTGTAPITIETAVQVLISGVFWIDLTTAASPYTFSSAGTYRLVSRATNAATAIAVESVSVEVVVS